MLRINNPNNDSSQTPNQNIATQNPKTKMRTILIDPVKPNISSFELTGERAFDISHSIIKCKYLEAIVLHHNLSILINNCGLREAADCPSNAEQGFFVVLDLDGSPTNLILGRGLVMAVDHGGNSISLPHKVTTKYLSQYVRSIPAANNPAAVKLGAEIQANSGESVKYRNPNPTRHRKLMERALALCRK
jgi:hypothetical protein